MHDARLLSPGFALHQPHERGKRCVHARPRRGAWDRKSGCQPSIGSASMTASPRFRASQQTPLTAKHSLEPFANHPFRLPCRLTSTFNALAINISVLILGSLSCLSILLKCPLLIPDSCESVSSVIPFSSLICFNNISIFIKSPEVSLYNYLYIMYFVAFGQNVRGGGSALLHII